MTLRTILEELVFVKLEASDDMDNELCNRFISQAEQKIKELTISRTQISGIMAEDNMWTYLRDYGIDEVRRQHIYDRIAQATHSAMIKKMEGR